MLTPTTLKADGVNRYFGIPIRWKYGGAALLAEGSHGSVLEQWEKKYWERKRKAD